jgi:hypothetical protein
MYFDEREEAMDKPPLVKDVTPLPAGYSGSGSIKIVNPTSNHPRAIRQCSLMT